MMRLLLLLLLSHDRPRPFQRPVADDDNPSPSLLSRGRSQIATQYGIVRLYISTSRVGSLHNLMAWEVRPVGAPDIDYFLLFFRF
jgi:hypothetical protein